MIITALSPIRVGDVGGWTDTWFAGHGRVCSLSVYPYVEVQVETAPRDENLPRVAVHAENYGMHYEFNEVSEGGGFKLPLLECALRRLKIPDDRRLEIAIHCQVPPGASTGTSAAVSVACIAALDQLSPGRLTPYEVARMAHSIETEDLGLQAGIQDQLAAAYGGINLIEMRHFPEATVSPIALSDPLWWELERRLVLVYIGKPHHSSQVHREVIERLGPQASADPRLDQLRGLALGAKDALAMGAWEELGRVWNANTQVQRQLHPGLVNADFERIITIAAEHGCPGAKVNGAGGDGGSVTLLSGSRSDAKRALLRDLEHAGYTTLPLYLARQGLRVWSQ